MAKPENTEEYIPRRERAVQISQDMDELMDGMVLPSQVLRESENVATVDEDEEYGNDEWMHQLSTISTIKGHRVTDSIFDDKPGKKKKRKGKGKDHTDYNAVFSKEVALTETLLKEQIAFTQSMEKKYRAMEGQKSSARGIGKYQTDTAALINTSRSLSKDLVQQLINARKTIAELTIKENEKLQKANGNSDDLIGSSSKFLKDLITLDRGSIGAEIGGIDEVTDESELVDALEESLDAATKRGDYSRHSGEGSDGDRYLKYEGRKVTIHAVVDKDTNYTRFYAEDAEGEIIPDYPLPKNGTRLNLNTSTMIATDGYGEKYPFEFER